jgi:hypothetical protein
LLPPVRQEFATEQSFGHRVLPNREGLYWELVAVADREVLARGLSPNPGQARLEAVHVARKAREAGYGLDIPPYHTIEFSGGLLETIPAPTQHWAALPECG